MPICWILLTVSLVIGSTSSDHVVGIATITCPYDTCQQEIFSAPRLILHCQLLMLTTSITRGQKRLSVIARVPTLIGFDVGMFPGTAVTVSQLDFPTVDVVV